MENSSNQGVFERITTYKSFVVMTTLNQYLLLFEVGYHVIIRYFTQQYDRFLL